MNNSYSINQLDQMRLTKGKDELINQFNNFIVTNRASALDLINDDELQFTTFFILKDNIRDLNLIDELNERNKIAIEIISEVEENQIRSISNDITSLNHVQMVHLTLRWIVENVSEKIVNTIYNEVIDICAIFLIKVYRDKEILSIISDLIFNRRKNKEYLHELLWAFFDGHSLESIDYIIEKLKSNDKYKVDLACKLLNFIPNIKEEKSYEYAIKWLDNNKKYLYFTGQSQHECMNPKYCNINMEAKYLNKNVNVNTGEIKEQLSSTETKRLEEFKNLDNDIKNLLSNYSRWLNEYSINWWKIWSSYSINEQIKIAQRGGDDLHD